MGDVRRIDGGRAEQAAVTLDELACEGARRMIATALEFEVDEYVASFVEERDGDGARLVVRNGHARERGLTVGSGTMLDNNSSTLPWTASCDSARTAYSRAL